MTATQTFRIELISDTHGLVRDEVVAVLKECQHILHAGDFDEPEVLVKPRKFSPRTLITMRSGSIILVASLAAIAVACAGTALVQSPPGTTTIQPGPMNRPEIGKRAEPVTPPRLTGEEAEAFKRSMAAYQQCARDKAAEIQLADSVRNVIDLRDKRPFWESELKRNTTLRTQHPGGYEQMLKEGFASYRSLGGSAATIDAVRPMPSPCANPWETYKGPQAPLVDTRQMKVAP